MTGDNPYADWGIFHLLRPGQIEAIRNAHPIAYLPWGALEWHSYHNPVGLDGLIADELCQGLAERFGGLVFPPVYVATDTIKVAHGFPHSIEHPASTVENLCLEYCYQLHDEGYKVIVIVTGHCGGGHRDALTNAVEKANVELAAATVILIPAFDPIQDVWAVNHAAVGETSLQMFSDSSLVDLSALPGDRTANLNDDGVWGDDPSTASAAKGEEIKALFIERCGPLIRNATEQL